MRGRWARAVLGTLLATACALLGSHARALLWPGAHIRPGIGLDAASPAELLGAGAAAAPARGAGGVRAARGPANRSHDATLMYSTRDCPAFRWVPNTAFARHAPLPPSADRGSFDGGDLEGSCALEAAVAQRSHRGELAFTIASPSAAAAAVNLLWGLRAAGVGHSLLLTPAPSHCAVLAGARWRLGCAWTSLRVPGLRAGPGTAYRLEWSKLHYVRRLVALRINPLFIDADVAVLSTPYARLRAPPLSAHALVFGAAGSARTCRDVLLALIYCNRCAPDGPARALFDAAFVRHEALVLAPAATVDRYWSQLDSRGITAPPHTRVTQHRSNELLADVASSACCGRAVRHAVHPASARRLDLRAFKKATGLPRCTQLLLNQSGGGAAAAAQPGWRPLRGWHEPGLTAAERRSGLAVEVAADHSRERVSSSEGFEALLADVRMLATRGERAPPDAPSAAAAGADARARPGAPGGARLSAHALGAGAGDDGGSGGGSLIVFTDAHVSSEEAHRAPPTAEPSAEPAARGESLALAPRTLLTNFNGFGLHGDAASAHAATVHRPPSAHAPALLHFVGARAKLKFMQALGLMAPRAEAATWEVLLAHAAAEGEARAAAATALAGGAAAGGGGGATEAAEPRPRPPTAELMRSVEGALRRTSFNAVRADLLSAATAAAEALASDDEPGGACSGARGALQPSGPGWAEAVAAPTVSEIASRFNGVRAWLAVVAALGGRAAVDVTVPCSLLTARAGAGAAAARARANSTTAPAPAGMRACAAAAAADLRLRPVPTAVRGQPADADAAEPLTGLDVAAVPLGRCTGRELGSHAARAEAAERARTCELVWAHNPGRCNTSRHAFHRCTRVLGPARVLAECAHAPRATLVLAGAGATPALGWRAAKCAHGPAAAAAGRGSIDGAALGRLIQATRAPLLSLQLPAGERLPALRGVPSEQLAVAVRTATSVAADLAACGDDVQTLRALRSGRLEADADASEAEQPPSDGSCAQALSRAALRALGEHVDDCSASAVP